MNARDELEDDLNLYLPGYLEGAESDIPADHLAECLADWLHDEGWRKAADTRLEYGVRRPNGYGVASSSAGLSQGEAQSLAESWGEGNVIMSRTVTTGPWREVEQ